MKKALIYASVASMIDQFNMRNIEILQDLGYKVDVACNFETGSSISAERILKLKKRLYKIDVEFYHIPIPRKITSFTDIYKSLKKTRTLLRAKEYDLIHCHSPIGSVISRLSNILLFKKKSSLIYTAHGFHFHEKSSYKNWLVYYPVEKILSYFTDVLITINKEDYYRAQKSFKAKEVRYIPGIGVDTDFINSIEINRKEYRGLLGIGTKSFVILSVGELNENKNHEVIIESLRKLGKKDIVYLICGQGPLKSHLIAKATEFGLKESVHLLGYREDVIEIAKSSDIFVFPSKREGLGVAALEAMACGLPIITSDVHGIKDYSKDGVTGFSCSPNDVEGFAEHIEKLYLSENTRDMMRQNNICEVKKYSVQKVDKLLYELYKKYI